MTATPPIVDRETWQKQIDTQRVREKAHTREGMRLPRLAGGCRWSRSTRRRRWQSRRQPADHRPLEIGPSTRRYQDEQVTPHTRVASPLRRCPDEAPRSGREAECRSQTPARGVRSRVLDDHWQPA